MPDITTDNILVANQGRAPLVGFNFMLRVEALYDLPCKSVHAFTRELEYEIIQEGGLNDYVHMLRKPISKPFTLEVERYVGIDYLDPLPLGTDLLLPIILLVSRYCNSGTFVPSRTYIFTGCTVTQRNYGELSGDNAALLVETTTIAYREMSIVDTSWVQKKDVPPPAQTVESKVTLVAALDRLKSEVEEKVNRAQEIMEKTNEKMRQMDSLSTSLDVADGDMEKLIKNGSQVMDNIYGKMAEDRENLKKLTDELHKSSKGNSEQEKQKQRELQAAIDEIQSRINQVGDNLVGMNNLWISLPMLKSGLEKTNKFKDSHIQEAKETVKSAEKNCAEAKKKGAIVATMTELKDAQPPARIAKEQAKLCEKEASKANRAVDHLQGVLDKAKEALETASSLGLDEG